MIRQCLESPKHVNVIVIDSGSMNDLFIGVFLFVAVVTPLTYRVTEIFDQIQRNNNHLFNLFLPPSTSSQN